MIVTAKTAAVAVDAGHARVDGWTKNAEEQDCIIVTNFQHSRTDHVAIGWQGPETDAEKQISTLADCARGRRR